MTKGTPLLFRELNDVFPPYISRNVVGQLLNCQLEHISYLARWLQIYTDYTKKGPTEHSLAALSTGTRARGGLVGILESGSFRGSSSSDSDSDPPAIIEMTQMNTNVFGHHSILRKQATSILNGDMHLRFESLPWHT